MVDIRLDNLYIDKKATRVQYKSIGRGGKTNYPPRDNRSAHAAKLKQQFDLAWKHSIDSTDAGAVNSRQGVYLEIKGQAGYDLITRSLDNISQNVRLCNVKKEKDSADAEVITSTVFVPYKKRDFFVKKINQYKKTESQEVIGTIESINMAVVDSMWMSAKEEMPKKYPKWCEVWLMYRMNEKVEEVTDEFFEVCDLLNVKYDKERPKIVFPERLVLAVNANKLQLSELMIYSGRVAEFRSMQTPSSFFTKLQFEDQSEFVENLLSRLELPDDINASVCLLDTGVNNGHMLLSPVLKDNDMHFVHTVVDPYDDVNHGTRMAGIAAYFDLKQHLESSATVNMAHSLESVKLLDRRNANPSNLYGALTEEAIMLAEIENPQNRRAICMAITAQNNAPKNDGRPSSWSGAIDSILSGANEVDDINKSNKKRLMFVSAGNTHVSEIMDVEGDVETAIINHGVEDPAQSWNAITVGAYTELYDISATAQEGYKPLVAVGSYSPFTSTSTTWDEKWPIKPDIMFEGGNLAIDNLGFCTELPDLSLLTTCADVNHELFDTVNMTSAATAQAAWLGARLQSHFPEYWPETIRALMIHSAEWTEIMKTNILGNRNIKKSDYKKLLRICGYGVPNYERAVWSATNRVNLIIEDEMQPFVKDKSSIKTNEMHIHQIPWPSEVLMALEDRLVKMRVTLSYYVEPGPGEIGWKDKYRYPSCMLQFDVNNPQEDEMNFRKRLSLAERVDKNDKGNTKNDSNRWLIGSNARSSGSIHSDIWEGTASDLSQSNLIAIYPKTGWWKLRTHLKKFNSKIRYSLIVSIESPEQDIDLYTPIKTQLVNMIQSEITNEVVVGI